MNNKGNVRNDGQSMRKIVSAGDAAKGQAMRPAPVPIREGQTMPVGPNATSPVAAVPPGSAVPPKSSK